MYIILLHTTLLTSNTIITESLVKLKEGVNDFQLRWPSKLTFHNGRLYDFTQEEFEGIRALTKCLNTKKELYFIQKRDDIDWIVQKKEEASNYNSSYGTSFWVNFHYSDKSKKVLGPRRQIIPKLTDAGDKIRLDGSSRIKTKNDCLLMEQQEPRSYTLKRENCDILHQVICTKKLDFWLPKDYAPQIEEEKPWLYFKLNNFKQN